MISILKHIRYMFSLPCNKCMVDVVCKKGCRELANFAYNYFLYMNHIDNILQPEVKKRVGLGLAGGLFMAIVTIPAAFTLALVVPKYWTKEMELKYNSRMETTEERFLRSYTNGK